LCDPVEWLADEGWFRAPTGEWLPDLPVGAKGEPTEDPEQYREFIKQAVNNQHFHQLNVWAVVQRVLDFYENAQALGRPVPWGFDGNRLIVVPHVGYGENAFYDQHSKSLQFYYFGDLDQPGYTCLSHDIIAHETGHAVLDGIRPLYNESYSVQTAAFHEFIGDLTAIILALFNNDLRHTLAGVTVGDLEGVALVADLARQFGEAVAGRPYLRSATNLLTMDDVKASMSPHTVSQVLTGTMFEILVGIIKKQMDRNLPVTAAVPEVDEGVSSENGRTPAGAPPAARVSAREALWRAVGRFRSIALQGLDLCPPCDIQFVDYAGAILRNHILTDPVDERGYRPMMLDVFHRRGLCGCGRQPDEQLTRRCSFFEVMQQELTDPTERLNGPNIDRVSRSRAAAYYFLNDNRDALRIPRHQDIVVVDLYDNFKMGAAADRLPREVVLEYVWEEEVRLEPDPEKQLDFGRYNGQAVGMQCGGTLIFDERGNLLSWFHKPGTEHITPGEADKLRERLRQQLRVDKLDRARLADLEAGEQRKLALLCHVATATKSGMVGETQSDNPLVDRQRPISAVMKNGLLHLQVAPHLRKSDFDKEVAQWPVNY
jgi:hypothetical protein